MKRIYYTRVSLIDRWKNRDQEITCHQCLLLEVCPDLDISILAACHNTVDFNYILQR